MSRHEEAAAGRVQTQLEQAQEQLGELRTALATATAERDTTRVETAREREHTDLRVRDLHTTYTNDSTLRGTLGSGTT